MFFGRNLWIHSYYTPLKYLAPTWSANRAPEAHADDDFEVILSLKFAEIQYFPSEATFEVENCFSKNVTNMLLEHVWARNTMFWV